MLPLLQRAPQPAESQQRGRRRAAVSKQGLREAVDGVVLYRAVLELPQIVLQSLQGADEALGGVRVVEAAEEFQQVAQFLAPFAQVVQALGGPAARPHPSVAASTSMSHSHSSISRPYRLDRRARANSAWVRRCSRSSSACSGARSAADALADAWKSGKVSR